MLSKIQKFIALSREEKKLFIEAYMTLGIMRAAILTVSFKRLTRTLHHHTNPIKPPVLTDHQIRVASVVGLAIHRAAAYTPWKSSCLVQALTVQRMLQKRGIPGIFHLGVMKDKTTDDQIKAHAWSQCGENIITGANGSEKFTVISIFGWGRE
ncbi:MAG: lasso peptide biosynthesis B2 protein [Campylobacterales bacterium]|nr:lasso peptide biosynthesis B2 protein [Campylobacterales bacterium]